MTSRRPNMDLSLDDMIKANRQQDRKRHSQNTSSTHYNDPSSSPPPPSSPPSHRYREARRPHHHHHRHRHRHRLSQRNSRYFDDQDDRRHHSESVESKRPDRQKGFHSRRTNGKLMITNLHYEVTREDLKSLFETIGPVIKVFMHYDRAGRSNGMAEVSFEKIEDARIAQERFHNVPLDGLPMQIEMRTAPLRSEYDMALD